MTTDQETVSLLQELVRIPSWVPDDPKQEKLKYLQNENKLVDYLENWLKKNTHLKIERQPLKYGRFNLIASSGQPQLIFLAHTDTVAPSINAPYPQLEAQIHDGYVWGRGTTDMKSGIVSMLMAIKLVPRLNNFMIALYADEEYDFLGMKALSKKYSHLRPKLIVSSDGSDLRIGHGCRGLIEFRARIFGQTGHPARGTGHSAIQGTVQALNELKQYLDTFSHPLMGQTSFNLAYIFGGAQTTDAINKDNFLTKVGQAGNVVPDICEFVIDIRPASPDLTLEPVLNHLEALTSKNKLKLEIINKKHNLGAWYTDPQEIKSFLDNNSLDNPAASGYIDLQMFWEATGRPSAFMFGAGLGDSAHTPKERIATNDLLKERDFFLALLKKFNQSTN